MISPEIELTSELNLSGMYGKLWHVIAIRYFCSSAIGKQSQRANVTLLTYRVPGISFLIWVFVRKSYILAFQNIRNSKGSYF